MQVCAARSAKKKAPCWQTDKALQDRCTDDRKVFVFHVQIRIFRQWEHTSLSYIGHITNTAVPWFTGTYARPFAHAWNADSCACSCRQQHHLTFPKGPVILHNYAITKPSGVTWIYFSPGKKKRSTSCMLYMAKAWAGIRRGGRKITVYISVNHGITLLLQSSVSPTCCAGVPTCSRTRTSAKVTWICLPPEWDVTLPLFPLFLCFQIFLCPTFMSSSLTSRRDKDSKLNQKQEEEQSQIYHLKNDFVKWWTTAATNGWKMAGRRSDCFFSSARLSHSKLTICLWSLTLAHTFRTCIQVHVHITHMHACTHIHTHTTGPFPTQKSNN